MGNLEAVDVANGRRWASVKLRHAAGTAAVSGLSREEAQALADALETARIGWWCRALEPQIGKLSSIHDQLTQLADPPKYVGIDLIRDLMRDADTAAGGFAAHWPDSLSNSPEIRMLKTIVEFLEAPEDARAKANDVFIANELGRSRGFFDRIALTT